jgi:uncharacterized membrane protein
MSKKSKTRRAPAARSEAPVIATRPNWPLLALAVLGMVLTAYLSWTALSGTAVQGCAAGGGCETVLTSRWSKLFGLPTSLWGLLGYAALAGAAFIRRADKQWSYAWTIAFFGVCYSVYLTFVSLTILESACPYCLTSLALMTAIFALATWQRPPHLAHTSWIWPVAGRAVVAGVAILVLHANYTAPEPESLGPEDPAVRALAEHLADEGALFYGASWCPHCQEQKRLFGASVKRLPYIECSPAGQNAPQSPSCNRAGIQNYPTWIINGRAYPGQVLSLAELARLTAFPGAASFQ